MSQRRQVSRSRRRNLGQKNRKKNFQQNQLEILEYLENGGRTVRFGIDDTIVCLDPHVIMPKSTFVCLSYPDTTSVRTKTTSPVCNWSYRSSAFSPALSAGGSQGTVPGYTTWAAFYNNYRVHGFRIRGQLGNPESVPIVITIRPYTVTSITDNSYTTLAQVYNESGLPLCKELTLAAATGGNSVESINQYFSMTEVLGSTQWLTDDGYAASVTGNPGAFVFLLMSVAKIDNSNLTTGIYTMLHLDLDVEFYGRKNM